MNGEEEMVKFNKSQILYYQFNFTVLFRVRNEELETKNRTLENTPIPSSTEERWVEGRTSDWSEGRPKKWSREGRSSQWTGKEEGWQDHSDQET